jgi:uncharacterized protein (TIGR02466 family)
VEGAEQKMKTNIKAPVDVTGRHIGLQLVHEGYYYFDKEIIIDKAIETIYNLPVVSDPGTLEVGNAISTAHGKDKGPHTWPELKEFVNWSYHQANNILKGWGFKYKGLLITDSWMNRHGRGGWTNYHTHQLTDITIAAYVSAPPNSGRLLLVDPLENHWMGYNTVRNYDVPTGQPIEVADNKVIFFAPFIRHATEKSNSDEERWVISMNISAVGAREP